jgi:DNA-binding response OmpR family regulator
MAHAILVWIALAELRRQVSDFLCSCGFSVIVADARDQALEIASRLDEVRLILADSSVEDGGALVRGIGARAGTVSTLLISANPEYVNRALAPELALHFIEKPFAWRDLKNKIESVLAAE